MAWVNWPRRATPAAIGGSSSLGVEISASLARAATGQTSHNRVVLLDDPHAHLPLAIGMEHRSPAVGRTGIALIRKLPHLSCTGFVPFVGQPQEWKGGRHCLTADDALGLTFDQLRLACGEVANVFVGLPAYLTHDQVVKLKILAAKHRFPIKGTAVSSLALAADRATALLAQPSQLEPNDGIVPMHRPGNVPWPVDAIVVDADEHALTGSLIRIEPHQVSILATTMLPRSGVKQWKERLLNAFADRCVRVCRRDPRDSAEAEQALYDQIDASLDPIRAGQHVTLTIRAAHWYQDLHLQPDDFEACCSALLRSSVAGLRELLNAGRVNEPPRAVWLTHEAGRLPGLAAAIYQNMTERTSVGVLRPEAVAIAVANLGEHWPAGEHHAMTIPIRIKPSVPARTVVPIERSV